MGHTFTDIPKLSNSNVDLSAMGLDEKVFKIDSVQSLESQRELLLDKIDNSSIGSNKTPR
jgi:hypothetical protein